MYASDDSDSDAGPTLDEFCKLLVARRDAHGIHDAAKAKKAAVIRCKRALIEQGAQRPQANTANVL